MITQKMMIEYLKCKEAADKLELIKKEIISAIKVGERVEPGKFYPTMKETERKNVSWKNIVIELIGKENAEKEAEIHSEKSKVYSLTIVEIK